MSGEFLGIYENSVNKQRVTIPSDFKKKFNPAAKQSVVITLGWNKKIYIYPMDNWNEMKVKFSKGDEKKLQLLKFLRDFAMSDQELEGPGRVRISEELLEIANIKDKVIIKGEGNFISLQNPESFKQERLKKLEQKEKNYQEMDYEW